MLARSHTMATRADRAPAEARPHRTKIKLLLAGAWLLVVAHILLGPDGGDDLEDLTFGAPERDVRQAALGAPAHDGRSFEEELDAIEAARRAPLGGGAGAAEARSSVENTRRDYRADAEAKMDTAHTIPIGRVEQAQSDYRAEVEGGAGTGPDASAGATGGSATRGSEDAATADPGTDTDESVDATGGSATRGSEDTATADPSSNDTSALEMLVEALQSTTFEQCCIPAALTRTRDPKDTNCFGTCNTERACTDPVYPFRSAEERALFPPANRTQGDKKRLKYACNSPESLRPPVAWCQAPRGDRENGTAARLVDGIPPAGCSGVTHGGGSGAFQHALLFPGAKLAFCGIPKVGITQWEQFLRFSFGAKDYPALPHYKLDRTLFHFDNLEPSAQRRLWEDEEWTWAAFVRDPAERLLSAFLDKVDTKGSTLTFEAFVDSLAESANFTQCQKNSRRGLSWCSDPHWRPQVYSCGLSERLDRFQFIGELHQAAEHTRELLGHVGLWESHGRHFLHGGVQVGRSPWCNIRSHPAGGVRHVGFQQRDVGTNTSAAQVAYGHTKGARDRMARYFTPDLLRTVREDLYPEDYALWKLVKDNGEKLSKGTELAAQLSKQCHGTHVVMPLP